MKVKRNGILRAHTLTVNEKDIAMCLDNDVQSVAAEIVSYLKKRPLAADTLDGIAYWWLAQQVIHKNIKLIEQALEQLLEAGTIQKHVHISGKEAVYSLNVEPPSP